MAGADHLVFRTQASGAAVAGADHLVFRTLASGAAVAGADHLVFRTQAVGADLHPEVCEHVSSTHSPRLP